MMCLSWDPKRRCYPGGELGLVAGENGQLYSDAESGGPCPSATWFYIVTGLLAVALLAEGGHHRR